LIISQFLISQSNEAPVVSAFGNQAFCPGSTVPIVENFSITDMDDLDIDVFFIQISEGYEPSSDLLSYNITPNPYDISWNPSEGKLTIRGNGGGKIDLTDLENVVRNVVFSSSLANPVTEKSFSLTIGNANYLPTTEHYYEFVSDLDISWTNAKIAAENRTYFGLKGYLVTILSQEEAQISSEQAQGTGWIGGTDEETEGVWKWATGPEAGTIFWTGRASGTTPNYANWNNNEPNDFRENNNTGEDYAHITDPSIGISGAWNDLPNIGGNNLYRAQGYIVEYGGSTGDPTLNISASTSIYIPEITNFTEDQVCESGIAQLSATTTSQGDIIWFDNQNSTSPIFTGDTFTTPVLTTTTTYYVAVSMNGCLTAIKVPIRAVVNEKPVITSFTEDLICSGEAILSAESSAGDVYWYESITSTTPIHIGDNYKTPNLNTTTRYFVEANISNCVSNRVEIRAIVDATIPEFDLENINYTLCTNLENINLKTINAKGNYRYFWTKDGAVIPQNTSEIQINSEGSYTVKAFSEAGCESDEKTIIVETSEIAEITIEDVLIIDDSDNNSIEIQNVNLGIGDYEFSIDDEFGNYQTNTKFENIEIGVHTLFIRDKNGCGITNFVFSILSYPKYFTPNFDGNNDFWNLKGFDTNQYSVSDIYIYNRFGKLIHKIKTNEVGWDGTINGRLLESNDYWFYVILKDNNGLSIEKRGNFSLIRK